MKIQLSISATKLPNVAGIFQGTSDPYAVVTLLPNGTSSSPTVLGKTEVLENTLSPDWVTTFALDYELGTPLNVAISVFDEIKQGKDKCMGSVTFDIDTVLGTTGNARAKKLKNGGAIFLRVDKLAGSGTLKFRMSGVKLKNVEGFIKKSDPFFELRRQDDGPSGTMWNTVYRSPHVNDNLNPNWDEDTVDMSVICSGNEDMPIQVIVYDHESSGKHVEIGDFKTTVRGIVVAKSSGGFVLKHKGKETGRFVVHVAEVKGVHNAENNLAGKMAATSISKPEVLYNPRPSDAPAKMGAASLAYVPSPLTKATFIDYISGGCQLNLCVAIDFTGSNGDPRMPGTLHYIDPDGSKNDYEKAISAIGTILAKYDSDQKFPVWGFGAKHGGIVRHCFQCGSQPEMHSVSGVLEAYRQTFKSGLIMSGPTVLDEVIQTAGAFASSSQAAAQKRNEQSFTILLILTDGSVTDTHATAMALDSVSDSPLAVVIVGVGQADFTGMSFLDDRKVAGKPDMVQFVEFNAHKHDLNSLTRATLAEIPTQLEGYFIMRGIKPLPAVRRADQDIVIEPEENEIDLSFDFRGDDREVFVTGGGTFVPSKAY